MAAEAWTEGLCFKVLKSSMAISIKYYAKKKASSVRPACFEKRSKKRRGECDLTSKSTAKRIFYSILRI